jgi:hypothetical protein
MDQMVAQIILPLLLWSLMSCAKSGEKSKFIGGYKIIKYH